MKNRRTLVLCIILAASLLVFIGYLSARQVNTDGQGPEITMDSAPLTLSVTDTEEAYLQGVSAYDDQDGDVSAKILVENIYGVTEDHQVTVTYAAFDNSGNVTKAERQVTLEDYRSPRFTLSRALAFPNNAGVDMMDFIGAEDVVDGDIRRWVRAALTSNSGSLLDEGIHDVQLRVTNSMGDTAELVLPVEVYHAEKYNADLTLNAYIVYLSQGDPFDAQSYLSTFAFAGKKIDLTHIPDNISITIVDHVDTQTPGVYPVAYTVKHVINHTGYSAYSKLFVVVEE